MELLDVADFDSEFTVIFHICSMMVIVSTHHNNPFSAYAWIVTKTETLFYTAFFHEHQGLKLNGLVKAEMVSESRLLM